MVNIQYTQILSVPRSFKSGGTYVYSRCRALNGNGKPYTGYEKETLAETGRGFL